MKNNAIIYNTHVQYTRQIGLIFTGVLKQTQKYYKAYFSLEKCDLSLKKNRAEGRHCPGFELIHRSLFNPDVS